MVAFGICRSHSLADSCSFSSLLCYRKLLISPWIIQTAVQGAVTFELSVLTGFPYMHWPWSGIIFLYICAILQFIWSYIIVTTVTCALHTRDAACHSSYSPCSMINCPVKILLWHMLAHIGLTESLHTQSFGCEALASVIFTVEDFMTCSWYDENLNTACSCHFSYI